VAGRREWREDLFSDLWSCFALGQYSGTGLSQPEVSFFSKRPGETFGKTTLCFSRCMCAHSSYQTPLSLKVLILGFFT
jgi:hypothetical protein